MKECGCQRCGGELLQRGDFYVCKHCHKTFTDVTVEKTYAQLEASLRNTLGETIQEELIKREAEKFRPLLGQLWEKTQAKYTDSDAIVRICQQIKNIYPENFLANFYEVANSGTVEEIADFLNGIDEKEYAAYVDDVVEFMIKSLEMGYVAPLNYLIERAYKNTNMPAFERYSTKVEEEASRLDAGTYNTEIPREVFVAYSSKDMQEVIKLVERIEAQGVRCFFAMRNLRHGRGAKANYEREIEKAIDNCKTIIFVSSKNSRRLDCDALNIELPYVKKKDVENTPPGLKRDYTKIPQRYKKLRIEYRLDNEKTPMADVSLREFFAGLEYRKSLDDVLDLLAMYLTDGDALVEEDVVLEKERKSSFTKEDIKQYLAELDREKQEEAARKKAEEEARQAALKLQAEAWCQTGENYYYGKNGVQQSFEEAVKWLKKAAEQGHAGAQVMLGWCYQRGQGVEQSYTEAFKCFKKAAEQGNAKAQNCLARCYEKGQGVEQSYTKAVEWYKKAAEQGDAHGQYCLARCYEKGQGVEQSYTEAVKWYKKAAEQGDTYGQYYLGQCYQRGEGVPQSYTEAVKWYKKAAEQGNMWAQCDLGECYEKGQGVVQSNTEAAKWYQKAAEQRHPWAQSAYEKLLKKLKKEKEVEVEAWYQKGENYYYGENGVQQNHTEAVKWYQKAAEQGHARAQYLLGICYWHGYGVEKSLEESVKWYQKAAEGGDEDAQYELGRCYAYGWVVQQNHTEALKWYQKAAEQGNSFAQEEYDCLKNIGTTYCYDIVDEDYEIEMPVKKRRGLFGWLKKH